VIDSWACVLFDWTMPNKDLDLLFDKQAFNRKMADALPISDEGKVNLCRLMDFLMELDEKYKNVLNSVRKYAVIRGGKVIEGHPTEIGFEDKQEVPAIFSVRILMDNNDKKPQYLAYSTEGHCVAEGSKREMVLKAMHKEIIRMLEYRKEQVPRPIIMEVDKCHFDDPWMYDRIKERQADSVAFYEEQRQWEEEWKRKLDRIENPGKTCLIDYEE
jgi:hypothetical protein